MKRFTIPLLVLLLTSTVVAQPSETHEPGRFLGYEIGSRFTYHARIVDWFEHLASASERMRVVEYGKTTEGRPLIYGVFSTPERLANLEQLRREIEELRRPGTTQARADEITRTHPVIVWLGYGVHGNESSSSEAAMIVAGRLASGELDAELRDAIVIIDPVQNPDGRERYAVWYQQKVGRRPNSERHAIEHREPWPGGRFNHYMFDLNRDWAWTTQRESRLRVAAYRSWNPQVFADIHEMSYNSNYFFPPDANPVNANVPRGTVELLETFGRANASEFSQRRWPFFVGERFDLFYPGYGDAWPSLRGAVGMTYEVAGGGAAGLSIVREDGDVLTLADRVARHVLASVATIRTAASNRERLLEHTRQAALQPLTGDPRTWLLDAGDANAPELIAMLLRQGIEVGRLRVPARISAAPLEGTSAAQTRTFDAGTWVVTSAQPLGALVTTLLERSPALPARFVESQRQRVDSDEGDEFYDITAWSLPIAMNVAAWETRSRVADIERVSSLAPAAPVIPEAGYAWLVPPDQPDHDRFLSRLLGSNLRFRVSRIPLVRPGGVELPAGTLVIAGDTATRATLAELSEGLTVELESAKEVWSEGTPLGSTQIVSVKRPRIALVSDDTLDPTSFGSLWHLLDVDLEMPHTVVPLSTLSARTLKDFDVLLIPDGRLDLERDLGKTRLDELRQWIQVGGTLVAIRGSAEALRKKDIEISSLKQWEPEEEKADQGLRRDFRVPGTAFRTEVNRASFLSWGVERPPAVLMEGTTFLLPTGRRADDIVTVAATDPVVAGFAWPESLERVSGAAWLTHERLGAGNVITFADEPIFRGFWRGTLPYLVNALAYGPTFSR